MEEKYHLKIWLLTLVSLMRTYQDWKLGRAKPQAAATGMKMLGRNERDGLDEVFMSIHTNTDKYIKIKQISILIMSYKPKFSMQKLLKVAKYGLKETKTPQFLLNLAQKKKNLSK